MLIIMFFAFILIALLAHCAESSMLESVSWVLDMIVFVCLIAVMMHVVDSKKIDERIEMYYQENKKIESMIDELVDQYMDYESETYEELKGENIIALTSVYPELKSDALIAKEIEIYIENNNKICQLKREKIDLSVYKWWLYFGW